MAYYEFAESYEKGNTMNNLINAMTFYQYARESAGVFLIKLNSTASTTESWTNPVEVPTSTTSTVNPAFSSTNTSSNESEGIKSVCGPAFIVGLAVLPLLFRRRR
jgi:uncharacterized protein